MSQLWVARGRVFRLSEIVEESKFVYIFAAAIDACCEAWNKFTKLTNAPYKRYVQIGDGTHTVLMKKNRMRLLQAMQQFLDDDITPGV